MEGRPFKYIRPDDGGIAPTPHLLLAGPADDIRGLTATLQTLSATHITDPAPPHYSHRFASFSTLDAATAAVTALAASYPAVVPKYAGIRPVKASSTLPQPDTLPAVLTAEECGIPGLALYPDFISAEEEAALLEEIDPLPWVTMARRRVQHYGHPFDYAGRTVDRKGTAAELPPHAAALLPRLTALPDVGPLDQLTVNEYPAGVGIGPHVETHSAFGDAIAALSLAGSGAMIFRRDGDQRAIFLPPRSLLIMSGEARLAWAHYVPHRKADPVVGQEAPVPRGQRRVSYTFRLVRQGPCTCAYPELCDSQDGSIPPTRASLAAAAAETEDSAPQPPEDPDVDKKAQELEDANVRDVYDAIAPHFSATRFAVWPAVRRFADSWPAGAIVADVGCGNGKYFSLRQDAFTAGSDRSAGLAAVAARRLAPAAADIPSLRAPLADVLVADGLNLPYRSGTCDAVLCIAVLHHLATPARRVALLSALCDLLVPGGRALVTVWATEQENMKKMAKWEPIKPDSAENGSGDGESGGRDCLVPWHLPLHRAEAAAAAKSETDKAIDSAKNALVFRRYYHLFGPGELDGLVAQVPGAAVVESFYDKDNWCVVMERTREG